MKITKQLAREIADACTLDRYNKLESDIEQFKSSTHQLLMGFIPEDVRNLFLKRPNYINKDDATFIIGENLREPVWLSLGKDLPTTGSRSRYGQNPNMLEISDQAYKDISEMVSCLEERGKSLDKDYELLENSIFSFRTKANAVKHLPELEKYFPAESNSVTSLAPTIESVREVLNKN